MVKKNSSVIEKLIHKYLHELFSFILSSVEGSLEKSVDKFSNFTNIKKKWHRYIASIALMTSGIMIIALGISALVESFIMIWKPGIVYILVGIFFILIAAAYRKLS